MQIHVVKWVETTSFLLVWSSAAVCRRSISPEHVIQKRVECPSHRRWKKLPCTLQLLVCLFVCFLARQPPVGQASSFAKFLDHTRRRTTVCRTPLYKWSARRRDPYLTTHNTTNIVAPGGIRTHELSMRAAADLWLRTSSTVTGYYTDILLSRLKHYRIS